MQVNATMTARALLIAYLTITSLALLEPAAASLPSATETNCIGAVCSTLTLSILPGEGLIVAEASGYGSHAGRVYVEIQIGTGFEPAAYAECVYVETPLTHGCAVDAALIYDAANDECVRAVAFTSGPTDFAQHALATGDLMTWRVYSRVSLGNCSV